MSTDLPYSRAIAPTSVGVAFDYHFVLQATALLMALMAIDEIVLALHMALMAVVTRLLAVERINCPCIVIHFKGGSIRAGSRVHCSRQRGCTDGSRDDNRTKSVNRVTFVHKIKASDVACDSYLVTMRGNSRVH